MGISCHIAFMTGSIPEEDLIIWSHQFDLKILFIMFKYDIECDDCQ